MGWANCGKNYETGEMMGYAHTGICHEKGCAAKIDHGLSYVCGGMHEGGENGCGYYFCSEHLHYSLMEGDHAVQACQSCGGGVEVVD